MHSQELYTPPYDFSKGRNAVAWRNILSDPLLKVLKQVHPFLTIGEEALGYVNTLIVQLLGIICSRPTPYTVLDVENRISSFPSPIDKWAVDEAKKALNEWSKGHHSIVFPAEKLRQILQKDVLQYKIDIQVAVYMSAALEYIAADLFKLAGNYVKNINRMDISLQDVKVAICADKVLCDLFSNNMTEYITENEKNTLLLDYNSVVKNFVYDEKEYLHNLHMITKVFIKNANNICRIEKVPELQSFFQNLHELIDLTFNLVTLLEEAVETSDSDQVPLIANCIEELAEDEEFELYSYFTRDIIEYHCSSKLVDAITRENSLNDNNNSSQSSGQGFLEAVKYYLPRLLHYPIWHCFIYFDYVKLLQDLTTQEAERETLRQVEGLLTPLRTDMLELVSHLPKRENEYGLRIHNRSRSLLVTDRVRELMSVVDGFQEAYVKTLCSELLRDGILMCNGSSSCSNINKRQKERRAILFDGMLVICRRKRTLSLTLSTSTAPVAEYKMKTVFLVRKMSIRDKDDTEDLKNAFELVPKDHPPTVFFTKTPEEKTDWMSDLVMLNMKPILDRSLNNILENEEMKYPVTMPPESIYRFAQPDCPANIRFEERGPRAGQVKGATLIKLIERLTYHKTTDLQYTRTFLVSYVTFTTPEMLLAFLMERYNVPSSSVVFDTSNYSNLSFEERENIRRYKKRYYQPIKIRVLNAIKYWINNFFEDFTKSPKLLETLKKHISSMPDRLGQKWGEHTLKMLERKQVTWDKPIKYTYESEPPPIEYHIMCPESEWTILTLHPVEIARQLTLIAFDMYQAVKSTDLISLKWTKEDKSCSIVRIMKHTTNFTVWLEKSIVETPNFEERVAIVNRIIEIMCVLKELNNFNGVISVCSAINSSSVHRLNHTLEGCPSRLQKALAEARDFCDNHLKKYQQKLRTISSPCIPFLGVFLTKILHIEEAHSDFLDENKQLINFSKRRRAMEIIEEVQQFQNIPYCLAVEPSIRNFLENLDPFADMAEEDVYNYLFQKSIEIEPKSTKQPSRCPRKWPDINLKSPGIKSQFRMRGKIRRASLVKQKSDSPRGSLPNSSSFSGLSSRPTSFIFPDPDPDHRSCCNADEKVFVPVMLPISPVEPNPYCKFRVTSSSTIDLLSSCRDRSTSRDILSSSRDLTSNFRDLLTTFRDLPSSSTDFLPSSNTSSTALARRRRRKRINRPKSLL